ncbi:hypothetical protein EJ04DRAFT_590472 [Polyplosphaeria fusca]|uniref:Acid phosphatase n=1 Tax=Polyplosphaeria fusca TaxID=682080 RepID=A0A9P4V4I6_9PLEO|nr:hypothetical protein EJ04DRAFT_590472 [Polyplosphaeria fusca]
MLQVNMLVKYLNLMAAASSTLALAAPRVIPRQGEPAPSVTHTSTASSDVSAAAATALTESTTSHVKGKAFDRIMMVYLETTAYQNAIADANCQALFNRGILHTNTFGVGSPSQPNYIAPGSGDTFGLNSDSFILVNKNVSTIVDLLEDKGISWSDYNEGLPYTGFEGFAYSNDQGEGNYERKHNLLARFESIRLNPHRISRVKNLTLFYRDLQQKVLPQWIFVTPNLYNDGHDTNISVSCNWTRSFVEPLLKNPYFNKNTLVYITWQANGQYPQERNHVAGILLGSAIPKKLIGTKDGAYYNHYSDLATVEANWNLHHLGRWDVGANVWSAVGSCTGDKIRPWNDRIAHGSFESYYWNQSYGGVFSSAVNTTHTYVAPNVNLVHNGRTILPAIKSLWKDNCKNNGGYGYRQNTGYCLPSYYKDIIELPDDFHPPRGFEVPIPLDPAPPVKTPITEYPYNNPPSS